MSNLDLLLAAVLAQAIGIAFLGNAVLLQRPRRAVEDFFGAKVRVETLKVCQEHELRKIHSLSGFAFLFLGFGLQFAGLVVPPLSASRPSWVLLALLGLLALLSVAVAAWGTRLARRALKRHLRDFFQRNAWPFEQHISLTKEIGALFEISGSREDAIEDYVARVRVALGLPADVLRPAARREPRPVPTPMRSSAVGF
jgi:hypothetical protein